MIQWQKLSAQGKTGEKGTNNNNLCLNTSMIPSGLINHIHSCDTKGRFCLNLNNLLKTGWIIMRCIIFTKKKLFGNWSDNWEQRFSGYQSSGLLSVWLKHYCLSGWWWMVLLFRLEGHVCFYSWGQIKETKWTSLLLLLIHSLSGAKFHS